MQINDILYTPLDVSKKPKFGIRKLKHWLSQYKDCAVFWDNK